MEKERYEFKEVESELDLYDTDIVVADNDNDGIIRFNNICKALNQQDARIKELEEENQQLKIENGNLKEKISTQLHNNVDNVDFMETQRKVIEQLKQSQNQKAADVLEKIRKYFYKGDCSLIDGCELEEFIANQLKELKGGNNE